MPCNIQYYDYGCNGVADLNGNVPQAIATDTTQTYQAIFNRLSQLNLFQYQVLVRSATLTAANYNALLANVRTFLAAAPGYRVLITLPDGTVLIDSARVDDAASVVVNVTANSFANFRAGTINANHNTRVAVLNAQLNCDGYGYEKKFSVTTLQQEAYVAARLGMQYNNEGTIRLSLPLQI